MLPRGLWMSTKSHKPSYTRSFCALPFWRLHMSLRIKESWTPRSCDTWIGSSCGLKRGSILPRTSPSSGDVILANGTMNSGQFEEFVTFSTTMGTVLKLSVWKGGFGSNFHRCWERKALNGHLGRVALGPYEVHYWHRSFHRRGCSKAILPGCVWF